MKEEEEAASDYNGVGLLFLNLVRVWFWKYFTELLFS